MICTSCGGENDEGRKFCGECGAALARLCPACGSANPPRVKFCGECGSSLGDGPQAPAPGARTVDPGPGAPSATTERRLVTVLFADLVGFTSLSEGRDSEDVRELLTRYFDTCRTVVERYGGVVEKFIGDAVMAVWGTPVAKEDDAERCVRAALELVDAVEALGHAEGAPGLAARAGIMTGEATVDLAASGQGMVAGDLVNTASRVQSAAEPGAVFAGEATKRATDASVVYQDAGIHTLKGKAEPTQLWRAHRVVAGVGGRLKSEGLEAPFVGRDRELKLVKDLFHATVDEGRAHLVQVTGIAGIGKSRLVWEFYKYFDGLEAAFFWHRARCLSYGEGVTYWALAEMVRGRAEIVEGEDRGSALAKLHDAVEQYVPSPEERKFVEPRLAHLLGLEDRTAPDQSDLFAGWRLFFERLTEQDPVIMVFEDVQWADPSLLEFIDHLMEWSRAFPIFVMTLGRPDAGAPGATRTRASTAISLEPLPGPAMEELITGLVPGLPEELTAQILERAQGVPLYAVETVRMLLDRGLLVPEGSVYRPAGPIDDLSVPETLVALIAARLDGLGPGERRLVQDAAVLGKTFTRAALAALSGLAERDLEPLLAALVAKEVLSVQADPRSPERGQYGFLQELVRTVAYDTLSKRDRKDKHVRVAEYLEAAWGAEEEEIVEVVASHYMEAYELAPDADDARELRGRAGRMLVRAAERAASLAAAEEAEGYFRHAAEVVDNDVERAEVIERAGQMAMIRGRLDEATSDFEQATRLFEGSGQPHAAARVQARLADVEFRLNHLERALERCRSALEVLSGDEPDQERAIVAAQLGRFLAIGGQDLEALQVLEDALEMAAHLGLPEVYSNALSSRGIGLRRSGRLDEAKVLLQRAVDVALEHDLPSAASRAYNNLAVVWESLDRFEEEIVLTADALELARRKGDSSILTSWLIGAAVPLGMLGRWDEALAYANEARQMEELTQASWTTAGLLDLVPIHVARGELDEAAAILESERALADGDNIELVVMYSGTASELLRARGDLAGALAAAERGVAGREQFGLLAWPVKIALIGGIDAAVALGDAAKAEELLGIVTSAPPGLVSPLVRAHATRFAARLAAMRGDHDAVEPGFAAAEALFRSISTPFPLAVVQLEHAEWLVSQGRATEAEPLLEESVQAFRELRAQPWLDRASRVGAGSGRKELV